MSAHIPIHVSKDTYPWIGPEEADIAATLIELENGVSFEYASIIGLSNAVRKLSATVSVQDSDSTQQTLLRGLPYILQGQNYSGIAKIENAKLSGATLLVASKNLALSACLVFALETAKNKDAPPRVLRAGLCRPRQYAKLTAALGITQSNGKRRQRN